MPSHALSYLLFLLSASLAQAIPQPHVPQKEGIEWGPCSHDTQNLPVECGKLAVPLDYTDDSSDETLDLAVIKYPAQNGPSQGSILLNFGGPGQDGLESMISYAPIQGPITGGQFDLISWDPRGTGQTLRFQCFDPEDLGQQYAQGMPDASEVAAGAVWAESTIVAEACGKRLNETGDLVGMAFTARDMMQIVDALGEDGMLRYWGISGGTTLGATAAALFPEKIDRVLLDGVMNAHEYYHKSGETNILLSVDDTFEAFIAACHDSPKKCPLAALHDSPEDTIQAIVDLFEKLKKEPIPIALEGIPPLLIDYSLINPAILGTLYRPGAYQNLSIALAALLEGNPNELARIVTPVPQQAEAVMGIRCGDKIPRAAKLSDLSDLEAEFHSTSKYFPGFARGPYVYVCAQWPFEARERYEGDFKVKTENPILFVGNTYDPVTPLANAKNMSSSFEGSVVLQHNGFGHINFVQPSNCTIGHIKKYFADGTLPKEGTVCEPNKPLFADDKEIPTGGDSGDGKYPEGKDENKLKPEETETKNEPGSEETEPENEPEP